MYFWIIQTLFWFQLQEYIYVAAVSHKKYKKNNWEARRKKEVDGKYVVQFVVILTVVVKFCTAFTLRIKSPVSFSF